MNELLQLSANGLFRGIAYATLGAGLALVLGVTGRFHFAYALTYTFTAYAAFLAGEWLGLSFWPAAVVGVLATVLLSMAIELFIYRPVAARAGKGALLAVLVTSMGVSTAGIALLQLLAGSSSLPFYGPTQTTIALGGVTFMNFDVYQGVLGVLLILALALLLAKTPLGRSIKATRSNPGLARVLGVNIGRVHLVVFAIAGIFCGVSSIWYGLQYTVEPIMGDRIIIYGFVVAFLAGIRSGPLRALAVGVGLGLFEQWISIWLSVQWTQTAVFTVLALYLIFLSLRGRMTLRLRLPRPAKA